VAEAHGGGTNRAPGSHDRAGQSILVAGLEPCSRGVYGGGDSLRMRYGSGCGGCTHFLSRKVLLDEIYQGGVVRPTLALARSFKWFRPDRH